MLTSAGDLALAGTVGLEVAQWRGPLQGLGGVLFTYHCTGESFLLWSECLRRGGSVNAAFGVEWYVDVNWLDVVTP
jgi:hypothetical protein